MHFSSESRETVKVRVVSTTFVVVTLAVFKPFGLAQWQWMAYLHLLAIWALGIGGCILTDALLKNILKMPNSIERGVEYILRRNLWFQLINTLLISLVLCFYRHFFLSDLVEGNRLSWGNFFETLVIIAFCSFVIGFYWRFKFRSQYLAAELEEVRLLNEELRIKNEESIEKHSSLITHHSTLTLTGSTSDCLTLQIPDLLYIESVGNYVKVYHLCDGGVRSDMLRATSKQMEESLKGHPMLVRCHRAFLVNLGQVEKIVSQSGTMQLLMKYTHDTLPVSRSNINQVKSAFKNQ